MKSEFDNFNEIYEEIKAVFGADVAVRFYSLFRGQQISFPVRLFSKEYVERTVREEYNGKNAKELALRFGYSERRIREMAKKK